MMILPSVSVARVFQKCFDTDLFTKMKGVKVWCNKNEFKKGFAAKNLEDLTAKICKRLHWKQVHLFLEDGTEIDDEEYFQELSNQVRLFASKTAKFQMKNSDKNHLDEFLTKLRWQDGCKEAVDQIRKLMHDNDKLDRIKSYIQQNPTKANLSHRKDDPGWFQDISTNAQTKEEYLSKGCQARIRGYLAKAEAAIKLEQRLDFTRITNQFRMMLKQAKYNGHYFDRKTNLDRICDQNGVFYCEGRFDDKQCKYDGNNAALATPDLMHVINPYESGEARILFSTWNLDHV